MHSISGAGYLLSSSNKPNRTRKNEYHDFFIHLHHFDIYYSWLLMDYVEFKLLYDALNMGGILNYWLIFWGHNCRRKKKSDCRYVNSEKFDMTKILIVSTQIIHYKSGIMAQHACIFTLNSSFL